MSGSVTKACNNARNFTERAKEKGLPHNTKSLTETKEWLKKMDEARLKLEHYNEQMKTLFSAEERVDTNEDWSRTQTYCNFFKPYFLATRYNLYKILFDLQDTDPPGEPARILILADPTKGNMQSLPIPSGSLKVVTDRGEIQNLVVTDPMDGSAFHGFEDITEEQWAEMEDPNVTIRENVRGMGGAGVVDGAGGGPSIDTPAQQPSAEAMLNPLGARSKHGEVFQDFNQQQPRESVPYTSTLRQPIQFPQPTAPANEYKLFHGPTLFGNVTGINDELDGSPLDDFNNIGMRRREQPVGFQRQPRQLGSSDSTTVDIFKMFSNSLTSNFSASNLMPEKWNGDPSGFERFAMNWIKIDRHMDALNMSPAHRLGELMKVVSGTARLYIQSLPPMLDQSYWTALSLLYSVYSQRKTTLRTIIKNLLTMPVCQNTYSDQLKFHASITSYRTSIEALNIPPEQVLFGIELSIVETKLSPDLKKSWVRFVEKNRDLSNPLGYKLDWNIMSGTLLKFITENYKMAGDWSWQQNQQGSQGQRGQGQGGRRQIGTAAAASNASTGGQSKVETNSNQQQGKKGPGQASKPTSNPTSQKPNSANQGSQSGTAAAAAPGKPYSSQGAQKGRGIDKSSMIKGCVWCQKPNGYNQYRHKWSLGCPVIKLGTLTDDKIRDTVRQLKLCKACLMPGHDITTCPSPPYVKCAVDNCQQKHFKVFHNVKGEPRRGQWAAAAAQNP